VNQQSPVHKFVVLSTRWPTFLHLAPDEVHHNSFKFFFVANHCILFYFVLFYFILFYFLTVFSLDLTS
jgi:hypothetical protein